MEFTNPERSSSIAFRPNGVYKGKVVAIDNASNTVSVILPRVSARSARSNCKVLTGVMPAIGDQVGCVFAENQASELFVIGVIKNYSSDDTAPIIVCTSSTRPSSPPAGTLIYETDTTLGYFWTGTIWVSVEGSEQNFGNVFFSADGLGIGATTASQPLSVAQTSGTDYVSYNKSASAGLTNASAGAVIIGRATGPNVVVDSTTYAANNGTSASTALTGTVVQARNNGNPAALYLNPNGGDVRLETGGLVVNGDVTTLNGSSGRLKMPLSATYVDSGTMASARLTGSYPNVVVDGSQVTTGTVNFNRLGLAYPTSSAPAASATVIGYHYYDTTTHEFLVNTSGGYRKPWNMPWGFVTSASVTVNTASSSTTLVNVSGLSVNFTPVVGRRYKILVTGHKYGTVAGVAAVPAAGVAGVDSTTIRHSVTDGATTEFAIFDFVDGNPATNRFGTAFTTIHYETFATSTTVTRAVAVSRRSGAGAANLFADASRPATISVEDVGPVAGSTPPAGTFTLDSISMGILDQNVLG
jgi:hypothetical protein